MWHEVVAGQVLRFFKFQIWDFLLNLVRDRAVPAIFQHVSYIVEKVIHSEIRNVRYIDYQ